jgi:hypothetical protein
MSTASRAPTQRPVREMQCVAGRAIEAGQADRANSQLPEGDPWSAISRSSWQASMRIRSAARGKHALADHENGRVAARDLAKEASFVAIALQRSAEHVS